MKDSVEVQSYPVMINDIATSVKTSSPPFQFDLYNNYPNPFNPSTEISFSLQESEKVTLKVYNILGQEVALLVNQEMTAGQHSVKFVGNGLSSGVYIYKLNAGSFSSIKKMVLLK